MSRLEPLLLPNPSLLKSLWGPGIAKLNFSDEKMDLGCQDQCFLGKVRPLGSQAQLLIRKVGPVMPGSTFYWKSWTWESQAQLLQGTAGRRQYCLKKMRISEGRISSSSWSSIIYFLPRGSYFSSAGRKISFKQHMI